MKILVSPAKKLDFETEYLESDSETTTPRFVSESNKIAKHMKSLTPSDLSKLMKLSQNLADLNYKRFQDFKSKANTTLAKPAVFAFNGDTYSGLDIKSFKTLELKRAQKQLRILSGLYGILRPLDLIQPYRLEMGTKLKFESYKNLYDFWGNDVTQALNAELKNDELVVNCASNEYFQVIKPKELKGKLVTPVFKENKNGELKIISFNAKKARGMMARYIIKNNIKDIEGIKKFDLDGYSFDPNNNAKDFELLFTR